jgi:hypothetical protein
MSGLHRPSELVRPWCEAAGIDDARSITRLARWAGEPSATVRHWINGRTVPRGRAAVRIALALGVSVEAVLRACHEAAERWEARQAGALAALEAASGEPERRR